MGRAMARPLVSGGARVLVTGRAQASLDDARVQLGEREPLSDVTGSLDDNDALAEIVKDSSGKLDVMVLNAGIGYPIQSPEAGAVYAIGKRDCPHHLSGQRPGLAHVERLRCFAPGKVDEQHAIREEPAGRRTAGRLRPAMVARDPVAVGEARGCEPGQAQPRASARGGLPAPRRARRWDRKGRAGAVGARTMSPTAKTSGKPGRVRSG